MIKAINLTVDHATLYTYPKLMKGISDNIWMILEYKCGVKLTGSDAGYYSKDLEMSSFTDYNEPITLQNIPS